MVGAIYLQPTKTAEFIYLDFNILPTGATFPIIKIERYNIYNKTKNKTKIKWQY